MHIPRTSPVITVEAAINLSEDEFSKLIYNNHGLKTADILQVITHFENDVLVKMLAKDGPNSERYKFYNRILRIMYVALRAEEDVNFWREVAIKTKMSDEFNRQMATMYHNELLKYKSIEEVLHTGDLDKYIEQVKQRNKQ